MVLLLILLIITALIKHWQKLLLRLRFVITILGQTQILIINGKQKVYKTRKIMELNGMPVDIKIVN